MITLVQIEAIKASHPAEIAELKKFGRLLLTAKIVAHSYELLKNLGDRIVEAGGPKLEDLLEIETLTTGLVVAYARFFTTSTGFPKFSEKHVPPHLVPAHKEIMDLRHKRYAHHDGHETLAQQAIFLPREHDVLVGGQFEGLFCLGAPPVWKPLTEWIVEFMVDKQSEAPVRLSKASGLSFVMSEGPPK